MLSAQLFDRVFFAGGVWALVLLGLSYAVVAWLRSRPSLMEQKNTRVRDAVAATAGDFNRLREEIARLDGRVKHLEQECENLRTKIDEVEEDRDHWRARAMSAEAEMVRHQAYQQGSGEARQVAQNILSVERQQDRSGKKEGEK